MSKEYPLVFRRESKHRLFVKKMNEKIVAGLAVLEREIEIEPGRFGKFYFVGSVVTDPTLRLQGFQRELFHAVEEQAEKENIDAIVLWSSQMAFYERLGFFLGGLQGTWSSVSKTALTMNVGSAKFQGSGPGIFKSEFLRSFQSHSLVVKRTEEEMRLLFEVPQMRIAHTDKAYALMGKGEDFQSVCHEWAGPTEEVLQCLEVLRRESPEMKILSPGVLHTHEDHAVITKLEQSGYECRLEYLGLFKLISKNISKQDLDPATLKYPFFIWGLDSI